MNLTPERIDEVLRGSVYGGCTRGSWEWNEGHDYKAPSRCITMSRYTAKDEQVICAALSPDIGPSKNWCANAPVLRDAKLNAAKVILLEGMVRELVGALDGNLSWLTSYQGGGAMNAYDRSRAALRQAKQIMGEE